MTTRDEIKAMVGYMALAFPNYHPDITGQPNAIDVLADLLGDMPADTLHAAIKACCAEPGRQFAPSAGEIRGAAVKLHARASGVPSAAEAWGEVMRMPPSMETRNYSGEQDELGRMLFDLVHLKFSHPLVEKVARDLGWPDRLFTDNEAADRSQFVRAYEEATRRELENAATLPAISEYIRGQKQLAPGTHEIKMLAEGMKKR